MKHLAIILSLFTLHSSLFTLSLHAALPEDWDVDLAAQPPQVFTLQRPRGETYELKAALKRHGKPFAPAITNACIFWQTNGMENLYWSAPASVSNNVLRAFWLPEMDPGATTVRGYIGDPGHIYAAAFQFRFISSPGATPNELPLPQKVIDFAKVRVLNPPWSGGGGGGVDTNAVIDIIHATVDGAARPLPKYLHLYNADDSYPDEAAEYYAQRQGAGAVPAPQCSAVRSGGFLSRNFDYPFDDRAEFVVRVSAASERFASVGVAQVGTNLTEQMVTSGKPEYSRLYKALPGATVDGINENGVACNINVVDGDPQTSGWHNDTGDLHPLAAVRWILDNATNAQHAAEYISAHIRFPPGWTQNFHYMIADEQVTYIVENGDAFNINIEDRAVLTNTLVYFPPYSGSGVERFVLLDGGASITNAWYTRAYHRETNPPWVSDLRDVLAYTNDIFNAWASHPKEYFRGKTTNGQPWWQTCHTSIYDITNRVLRVSVQETDDWYTFALPCSGTDEAKVRAIAAEVVAPVSSVADQAMTDAANAYQFASAATQESYAAMQAAQAAQSAADNAQSAADNAQSTADAAQSTADNAQSAADNAQSTADNAQSTADAAQSTADNAQSTADAALPATHPNASVYGAWDYDSYSGEYGLSIYGTGDSRVWLTPFDVCFDSGGPYSTRISLVGLSDEVSYVYSDYYTLSSELWGHIYNYSGPNPHGVTAWDVGAPTVDEVEWMIGNITPESIGAATQYDIDNSISATEPNFRDQVLAVGMNIDPTAAAEINRILDRGGFESNCTVVVKTVLLNNDDVHRMIVESAKLYWDPGLRVTWQIDVTNGCFYSHIVSDDNLTNHIR